MSAAAPAQPRALMFATFAAFAAFGAFWGAWGASIPRIRDQAGVDDAELGIALLCIGVGALPAMLLTGTLLDRWGLRIAAWLVLLLGVAGAAVAATATSLATLILGLLVVGMASGSADVAMNAVAGRAEQDLQLPIITRAHGLLSGFVVLGGLGAGVIAGAGKSVLIPFAVVAGISVLAAMTMLRFLPRTAATPRDDAAPAKAVLSRTARWALVLIGVLGALSFASESAHQNWSALFAYDVLNASDGWSAMAPVGFATVVAIARLTIGQLGARHPRAVLTIGGAVAAAGALIIAVSAGPFVFAAGLVIAAAGTAVLFPTVLGIVARRVDEERRGRATSLVTTVSYLGFLLAPAYVGLWADAINLRAAMVAVAALGAALLVLTGPLLARALPNDRLATD